MKSSKKENQSGKLTVTHRRLLVKEYSKGHLESSSYDRKTLKRILKHLSKQKEKKKELSTKENCCLGDSTESKVDHQVKLRCRQLPNVVEELRRALMRQDWDEATTLVMILCHPGLKYYSSIILKVCFILLFSHPKSNFSLLQNFVRLTTDYILEEDVNKFIRILFVLRKASLKPLENGKYIRKTSDHKVTRDFEFKEL